MMILISFFCILLKKCLVFHVFLSYGKTHIKLCLKPIVRIQPSILYDFPFRVKRKVVKGKSLDPDSSQPEPYPIETQQVVKKMKAELRNGRRK